MNEGTTAVQKIRDYIVETVENKENREGLR